MMPLILGNLMNTKMLYNKEEYLDIVLKLFCSDTASHPQSQSFPPYFLPLIVPFYNILSMFYLAETRTDIIETR